MNNGFHNYGERESCGANVIWSWIDSAGDRMDTSCLKEVLPPDYNGERWETQNLCKTRFGTNNCWGEFSAPDMQIEKLYEQVHQTPIYLYSGGRAPQTFKTYSPRKLAKMAVRKACP